MCKRKWKTCARVCRWKRAVLKRVNIPYGQLTEETWEKLKKSPLCAAKMSTSQQGKRRRRTRLGRLRRVLERVQPGCTTRPKKKNTNDPWEILPCEETVSSIEVVESEDAELSWSERAEIATMLDSLIGVDGGIRKKIMHMAGIPFRDARIAHWRGSGKKKRGMCVEVARGSRWKDVTSCFRGSRPSRSSQKLQREKHVFDKRMEKYEAMVKEDDAKKARRTSYQLSRKEQMRSRFAGKRRIPTIEFHRIQAVACARRVPPYSYCF